MHEEKKGCETVHIKIGTQDYKIVDNTLQVTTDAYKEGIVDVTIYSSTILDLPTMSKITLMVDSITTYHDGYVLSSNATYIDGLYEVQIQYVSGNLYRFKTQSFSLKLSDMVTDNTSEAVVDDTLVPLSTVINNINNQINYTITLDTSLSGVEVTYSDSTNSNVYDYITQLATDRGYILSDTTTGVLLSKYKAAVDTLEFKHFKVENINLADNVLPVSTVRFSNAYRYTTLTTEDIYCNGKTNSFFNLKNLVGLYLPKIELMVDSLSSETANGTYTEVGVAFSNTVKDGDDTSQIYFFVSALSNELSFNSENGTGTILTSTSRIRVTYKPVIKYDKYSDTALQDLLTNRTGGYITDNYTTCDDTLVGKAQSDARAKELIAVNNRDVANLTLVATHVPYADYISLLVGMHINYVSSEYGINNDYLVVSRNDHYSYVNQDYLDITLTVAPLPDYTTGKVNVKQSPQQAFRRTLSAIVSKDKKIEKIEKDLESLKTRSNKTNNVINEVASNSGSGGGTYLTKIEVRNSDPTTPIDGQIWVRSDLLG